MPNRQDSAPAMPCVSLRRSATGRWLASISLVVVVFLGVGSAAEETCLDCHDTDTERLAASVHGSLECLDCHPAAVEVPHPSDNLSHACVSCHDEIGAEYSRSIHGWLLSTGDPLVRGCEGCHEGGHDIRAGADPTSPTHPLRLAQTCGTCHASPEIAARAGIHIYQPLDAYAASIHARALAEGKPAATCSTCHGSHLILRASDPQSRVHHLHISETCSGCHQEIAGAYERSVHGQASADGVWESPVCTDCHGEHRILEPTRRDSPVYPSNIPKVTCGRCHGDLRLSEKFGLPGDKVPAYADSYHGLASRAGSLTVANCSSCHGVHDILPSDDPGSHIHADNLATTCGQCHAGAGSRFAIGPVHILPDQPDHPLVFWVRRAYIWVIAITIGLMLLHNGLDFFRKLRQPVRRPDAAPSDFPERMMFGFRLAHWLLVGSFALLVYTGFALTFPEAWWAAPLLVWEEQVGLRGWMHRGSAIVLLIAAVVHIAHLGTNPRARRLLTMMRPTREDWREFKQRCAYFTGRRPHPPQAAWIGYPEKLEYLAVVWGTVVMAVTGFVLWFETLVLRWLPTWVIDLATVIHFWEAVLASLAILVWHLYAVIFDPLVYPMDPAWLTGRSAPGRAIERRAPDDDAVDETAKPSSMVP